MKKTKNKTHYNEMHYFFGTVIGHFGIKCGSKSKGRLKEVSYMEDVDCKKCIKIQEKEQEKRNRAYFN